MAGLEGATPADDFEGLALSYLDALYKTAYYLTHSVQDAEDLTQETYLRAYRAYNQFQGGSIKAWLFAILRNAYIDQYRRHRHEPTMLDLETLENDNLPETMEGTVSPSAEQEVLQALFSEDVEQALRSLPSEWRLVLILADLEDFTYQEIADLTGTPIGTVMSRLYRSRKRFSQQLRLSARTRRSRTAGE